MSAYIVYSIANAGEQKPYAVNIARAGETIQCHERTQIVVHSVCGDMQTALKERDRIGIPTHRPMRYKRTGLRCLSDGRTFKNASAAARAYNLSNGSISLHLNNPTRYPTAGGYTFERIV